MSWELVIAGLVIFLAWRSNQNAAGAVFRSQPVGEPQLYATAPMPIGAAPAILCAGSAPSVVSAAGPALSYGPQSASVAAVPTGDAVTLPAYIARTGTLVERDRA